MTSLYLDPSWTRPWMGIRSWSRVEGKPRGRNPNGRVIKILNRAHPTVVGTFKESRRFGYVRPLNDRLFRDVLIPAGEEGEAKTGDIVVARISAYGDRKLNPMGSVERVLGPVSPTRGGCPLHSLRLRPGTGVPRGSGRGCPA